jgi:hypothetical protein
MNRSSRVFVPVGALALLFSEVLLIASCFLVVTFLILRVDPTVFLLSNNGLLRIALAGGSILFGLYFEDLYANLYVKSRVLLIQQLSLVMGIALLAQGLLGYVNDGFRLPFRLMVPACALLVVALFAWRMVYSIFVLRVVGAQRILLVGMCPLLVEMAAGDRLCGRWGRPGGRAPDRQTAGAAGRAAAHRRGDRAGPHCGWIRRPPRAHADRGFAAIALQRDGYRRGVHGL